MEILGKRQLILSPLMVVIFVTYLNTVYSRHYIRHYRDRFKRQQGANLFLPDSYVTDTDEPDEGVWSGWSSPSACSRTCGGGVSTQSRQCEPGSTCRGPKFRYISCNTQDCPDLSDFRAQQCTEFDKIPFEGVYYQWVPYTKAPNQCELNCMPIGERFYYRHKQQVADGTRCNDQSPDVCVQGKCQHVGCDMMLGSPVKEDNCRKCGGDGSTCQTITGRYDKQDLQVGYNNIILIPRGSTNIRVQEIEPSNNYLAIRNTSGHYYLNGNWRIDFPRTKEFAGTAFNYERFPQGFSAPDKITALGPTDEPLIIVLLYQDRNVGVDYEYSVPTLVSPGNDSEIYAWTFDPFSPCSATCGGGLQYRNVTCVGRQNLNPVDERLCDSNTKPAEVQECSSESCQAQWVPYPWGKCLAPCGGKGEQFREVICQQMNRGVSGVVSDDLCRNQPKPPTSKPCSRSALCPKWHTGPWKPCDHLCGDGVQTRKVRCFTKKDSKVEILDDAECTDAKPETEKPCNLRPCEGVDWIASDWSGCENKCGLSNETRKVHCASIKGKIYPDNLCVPELKPESVRKCEKTNTSCDYLFYASQWSECSAKCGQGIQTRTVFCGLTDGKTVTKVDDSKCDTTKTYETSRKCDAEQECGGEWFSGPWKECSSKCGGGIRTRKVVCLLDNEVVGPTECDMASIMYAQEDCNTFSCAEGEESSTIEDMSTTPSESSTTDLSSSQTETEMSTLETSDFTTSSTTLSEDYSTTEISEATDTSTTDISITSTDVASPENLISSEVTTSLPPTKEDDDYEYIESDTCDDGEWVDADTLEPLMADAPYFIPVEENVLSDDPLPEDEELMQSDQIAAASAVPPIVMLNTEAGSGDDEFSSSSMSSISTSDDFEGSGFSSTTTDMSSTSDNTESTIAITITTPASIATTEDHKEPVAPGEFDGSEAELGIPPDTTTIASTAKSGSDSTNKIDSSTESGSTTESDSTDASGPTEVSSSTESGTTDIFSTESGGTSESVQTTESGTTESGGSTESVITTESGTTKDVGESGATEETTSAFTGSTEISQSTTEFTGSTDMNTATTESGQTEESSMSTETTSSFTGSTESSGSTEISTEFTESTTDFTGSTTEFTGSTTEFTGSTTEFTGSTTEFTGSTTEFTGSTTEFTGSTSEFTGSTSEFTGSTETEFTESTSAGSTETDLWGSTEASTIKDLLMAKPRMCKRKKKKPQSQLCEKSKYGCCPDKITPAKGPFDEGCPIPQTCKESKFGCCDDEVSPALGENKEGCPSSHCNETLFGCCPDKKTPAEGNDNEGCPPPPPACLKSKYGCCEDNVTEAKGPKQKGCEKVVPKEDCKNTTYGCCPDNVTTAKGEDFAGCDIFKPNCQESYFRCCPDGTTSAKGPNYKGCEMPCSNSTFGCCPDGRSPAHGRSGEGCCLVYEYGCCPDNITPARGPQLEGCGCEYSSYGCCPDNQTVAKGPSKEGCGCSYSDHGCCPDDVTPAKGSDYEGCPCGSFQFGCCPDGVSTARGPNQQGCGCRNTEYGCCSDEVTPARGADKEGCDCASSKFGCCLDGVAEAKGENYEGCEEVPVNAQESCTLDKERGSCHNYTVKWFFDRDYAGCTRFWYGGCEGNSNRFKLKEECESVCVKPEGKDRCKLPKISGPCEGYYIQWYYDSEKKYCEQFVYSGCLGNNNRFETLEECNQLCSSGDSAEPCEQPVEEGPCRGNFPRWHFDKESKTCQQFRYGGCKANGNNFATEQACMQKCAAPGSKKEYCDLPKVEGNCTNQEARWYSDPAEKRCKPFYYTGCNGNDNNFISEAACESDCPKQVQRNSCHLPAETGGCANYTDRYYYDTKDKACRHFYYGGCGGNENNFLSEQQCQQRCVLGQEPITVPLITMPVTSPPEGPFLPEYCMSPSETGPCRAAMPRYFYDRTDGVCKNFIYGGCHGNRNNFESIDDCYRYCGNSQDLCALPPVAGDCQGEYSQYYYDQSTDSCKEFKYGGCGGNYNRFNDVTSCERRCKRSPSITNTITEVSTRTPAPRPSQAMCLEQPDPGNCGGNQPAYFFDSNTGRCTPFSYTGCGGNHNRFQSEEQCDRLCGQFAGQNVCEEEKDAGPCNYTYPKYYYDKYNRRCSQFTYGGCGGNGNRFSSATECESVCLTRSEILTNETDPAVCLLPIDSGTCEGGYNKRWYFNNDRGECIAFIYSGCGGNFNNFKTFQSCLTTCRDYLTQTEPPFPKPSDPNQCRSEFERCETLRCRYGIEAYVDENRCNNCRCHEPCREIECPDRTRCAIDLNRNKTSSRDPDFIAVCRQINKEGHCQRLEQDFNCEKECNSDADCTLDLKCCPTSCGTVCSVPVVREPAPLVTQPVPSYTEAPYYPVQVVEEEYKPEVTGEIGGHITLRCAVKGNPTPHIAWSKDGIEIDGTKSRYRIKLDQSLQIITLHTTDSGIYLCTADNNLGNPVENRIRLDVVVPVKVNITSPERRFPVDSDIKLVCDFQGYPPPQLSWYKDGVQLVSSNRINIEVHPTGYSRLVIFKATKADSGTYECEAINNYSRGTSSSTIAVEGKYVHPSCTDNQFFANCGLIVQQNYCNHKYYARFCCRSCTEAGLLPVDGPHLQGLDKYSAIRSNLV